MDAEQITGGCGCWSCRNFVPKTLRALEFIGTEAKTLRRELREAVPTPVAGVDAGLWVLQRTAEFTLGRETT